MSSYVCLKDGKSVPELIKHNKMIEDL